MDELMNIFGTKVPKGKSSFSPLANGENSKGFSKIQINNSNKSRQGPFWKKINKILRDQILGCYRQVDQTLVSNFFP